MFIKNIKNMNGGCLHLTTEGIHQTALWFMMAISTEPLRDQVVGQDKLLSKTGLWTGLLLEELSALTTAAFRDTAVTFVAATHKQLCLASLVLWLRHVGLILEEDISLVKNLQNYGRTHILTSTFHCLRETRKKSVWIYFIWQCKDRSQRRNPNDENSLEP